MDDLIVIAFSDDERRAAEVLSEIRQLGPDAGIDIDDAIVVTRGADGRVRLHQSVELTAEGARRGAFWGLLVGLVLALPFPFLGPVFAAGASAGGALVGAGIGALFANPDEAGIADDFARDVGEQLQPGSSAVFLLVSGSAIDSALPKLEVFGGTLLQTTLSPEAQQKLHSALSEKPGAR